MYIYHTHNIRLKNILNQELKQMHPFWPKLSNLMPRNWNLRHGQLGQTFFLLQATLKRKLEQFILKIAHLSHVKAVFFKKIMFTSRDFSYIFYLKFVRLSNTWWQDWLLTWYTFRLLSLQNTCSIFCPVRWDKQRLFYMLSTIFLTW